MYEGIFLYFVESKWLGIFFILDNRVQYDTISNKYIFLFLLYN